MSALPHEHARCLDTPRPWGAHAGLASPQRRPPQNRGLQKLKAHTCRPYPARCGNDSAAARARIFDDDWLVGATNPSFDNAHQGSPHRCEAPWAHGQARMLTRRARGATPHLRGQFKWRLHCTYMNSSNGMHSQRYRRKIAWQNAGDGSAPIKKSQPQTKIAERSMARRARTTTLCNANSTATPYEHARIFRDSTIHIF